MSKSDRESLSRYEVMNIIYDKLPEGILKLKMRNVFIFTPVKENK